MQTLFISFATTQIIEQTADYNYLSLFMRADIVVKSIMLVLVLASIWSWSIVLKKTSHLRKLQKKTTNFEKTFWEQGTFESSIEALGNKTEEPMGRVLNAVLREWHESRSLGLNNENDVRNAHQRIDKVMKLVLHRDINDLEIGISNLAIIASSTVFIGLFGTVWGIMNAFRSIASTQSTNLAVVAPGIAEALFATALGLFAAIPASIFYNKITNDIDLYSVHLESFTQELSAILSRKIGVTLI